MRLQQTAASDAGLKAELARMSSALQALRAESESAQAEGAQKLRSTSEQHAADMSSLLDRLTASQGKQHNPHGCSKGEFMWLSREPITWAGLAAALDSEENRDVPRCLCSVKLAKVWLAVAQRL